MKLTVSIDQTTAKDLIRRQMVNALAVQGIRDAEITVVITRDRKKAKVMDAPIQTGEMAQLVAAIGSSYYGQLSSEERKSFARIVTEKNKNFVAGVKQFRTEMRCGLAYAKYGTENLEEFARVYLANGRTIPATFMGYARM